MAISNRQAFEILRSPFRRYVLLLQDIHFNKVDITFPKKYTVSRDTDCLSITNSQYPNHKISVNLIVEDGYTRLVRVKNCPTLLVALKPGFIDDEFHVQFEQPISNSSFTYLLDKGIE